MKFRKKSNAAEKKKKSKKQENITKTNLDVLPIRDYDEDLNAFVLEDGSYLDIIEKVAEDVTNMLEDESQRLMIGFAKFLKLYKDDFKIVSMNFPTNTLEQQKNLQEIADKTNSPVRKKWLSRSISELTRADQGTRKREYHLFIFSKDKEEHYEHMKQLGVLGESIRAISLQKKRQIIYQLCNPNSLVLQEVETDLPLFEYIQPQGGITFKEPNYIVTGDGYTKVIHIYRLPTTLSDYWMTDIIKQEDCISTIDIATRDKHEVQKNINHALQEEYSRERHANDYQEIYDARKRQHQLQMMYDEVKSMGEVVKMMHFRLFVSGKSLVGLEEKCGDIMKNLETDEFLPTIMLNEGKREWKSMFQPYSRQMKEPFAMKGLSLMTEQIAGGYPFRFSSLDDENGDLLGFTGCGGVVVFNEFLKTDRRKHYNSVVIGDLGSGKSTYLKKRFRARAERGDFIRCFDISGEFTNLTKEFGGKVIRCDGAGGMLNPLEILRSGDDDGTNYARHISKVCAFYRCLSPDADDAMITNLQQVLRSLYEKYGLVPEKGRITGYPADQYPTFSDLLSYMDDLIEEKTQAAVSGNEVDRELLIAEIKGITAIRKKVDNLVRNYGPMFDGHTTIDNIIDEQIVTFDISTIKDMENLFVAQLFNMVYFCWDNCVANGSVMKQMYESGQLAFDDVVRFLILIDESHRWVNTKYPYILDRITVIMREARKYFAGIVLASQSFRDYNPGSAAGSAAVDKLKVVFELTQYKFIFKQDSSVLPLIDDLFGRMLSPWQRQKIPYLAKGETILSISGDRNIFFKVWLSKQYEEKLFSGGA